MTPTGRVDTVVVSDKIVTATEVFDGAVASMNLPAGTAHHEIVMVGDDLRGDIEGAQRAGYAAWLVRTGKFQEGQLARSGIRPDRVLQSVADLLES